MPQLAKAKCLNRAAGSAIVWSSRAETGVAAESGVTKVRGFSPATLLWIDDFKPGLKLYKQMFEDLGFRVLTADSGKAGLEIAAMNRIDIVVTDYEMPGLDGLAVANSMKALCARTPVVLFSGSTLVPRRVRRKVDACCDKASSRAELLATIHRLLQRKRSLRLQPQPVAQASHHGRGTVA